MHASKVLKPLDKHHSHTASIFKKSLMAAFLNHARFPLRMMPPIVIHSRSVHALGKFSEQHSARWVFLKRFGSFSNIKGLRCILEKSGLSGANLVLGFCLSVQSAFLARHSLLMLLAFPLGKSLTYKAYKTVLLCWITVLSVSC